MALHSMTGAVESGDRVDQVLIFYIAWTLPGERQSFDGLTPLLFGWFRNHP